MDAKKQTGMAHPFEFAGQHIPPGAVKRIDLPSPSLYQQAAGAVPVYIHHGKIQGPVLFITSAIHGDELNGIEIIWRLLQLPILKKLKGTVLALPIANIYGFTINSRYLPDRRDLNRIFPGSKTGSLAARLAHLIIHEIVSRANYGIDLHTGAIHRENLPQIRVDKDSEIAEGLAKAFGTPVILKSAIVEGSLRYAASKLNVPVLVYEGGEALRFDEVAIRSGVEGVLGVMRELDMLPQPTGQKLFSNRPHIAQSNFWLRAPASGLLKTRLKLGQAVQTEDVMGSIIDPFTEQEQEVMAPLPGIIIGKTNLPLVNEGDAIFHIAAVKDIAAVVEGVDALNRGTENTTDPLLYPS